MNIRDRIAMVLNGMTIGNDIGSIREFLLEKVIAIFFYLGIPAVIMGGWEVYKQDKLEVVIVYVLAYLPVAFCHVRSKAISYKKQAYILLIDLYILSVLVLAGVGLSGAGLHLLFTFCILTATFIGIRGGFMAVLLSCGSILSVGYGMYSGRIPIDIVAMTNSTRIEAWLMAATMFLIIGAILVLLPGLLQNSLQKTIGIIREKSLELESSNMRLKKALKEREEIEQKLIKAEKLEAIGLLAGGVAHDLNNILSGITTLPDLMLMNLEKDHEYYDSLMMMKSSGNKAATIVQDLLTLSRQGVNIKKNLHMNSLIQSYFQSPEYERLRQFHPEVVVELDLRDNVPIFKGSDVHLTNVVMNLISNAAEAMPQGGIIKVSVKPDRVEKGFHGYEYIPEGDYIRLSVSDDGSGIDMQDLDRIFEPFFTKKKMGRSGTGLGMAVVQSTVKDHKGFIDIETSKGVGTRFRLYFPVTSDQPSIEDQPISLEQMMGDGQTILLVDDVADQRIVGEQTLDHLGYHPVSVSSGEAAIDYCRSTRPDLLILDMIMDPGINGYETLTSIRKIYPGIPCVIITGYANIKEVNDSVSLGKVKVVKKPFSVQDLASAVHTSLNPGTAE